MYTYVCMSTYNYTYIYIYMLLIFLVYAPLLFATYGPVWLPPQILSDIGAPNSGAHGTLQCTMGRPKSCKKHPYKSHYIGTWGGVFLIS